MSAVVKAHPLDYQRRMARAMPRRGVMPWMRVGGAKKSPKTRWGLGMPSVDTCLKVKIKENYIFLLFMLR